MYDYVRIDALQDIDTNKIDGSRDSIICYYLYFVGINFRFQLK